MEWRSTSPSLTTSATQLVHTFIHLSLSIPLSLSLSLSLSLYPSLSIYLCSNSHPHSHIHSLTHTLNIYSGRAKGWKTGAKKDFSDSDRGFAHNLNLNFATPEEYFLRQRPAPFEWRGINPDQLLTEAKALRPFEGSAITKSAQEMIIFVGFPASGKSTFAREKLVSNGYEWINRDTLKTSSKCLKATRELLDEGKSVIIDNTNPSDSARAAYLTEAKNRNIPVRCFQFITERKLSEHLNLYRERITQGQYKRIPAIAYNMYNKNFVKPKIEEGFAEICKVNFVPNFQTAEERRVFLMR